MKAINVTILNSNTAHLRCQMPEHKRRQLNFLI